MTADEKAFITTSIAGIALGIVLAIIVILCVEKTAWWAAFHT